MHGDLLTDWYLSGIWHVSIGNLFLTSLSAAACKSHSFSMQFPAALLADKMEHFPGLLPLQ